MSVCRYQIFVTERTASTGKTMNAGTISIMIRNNEKSCCFPQNTKKKKVQPLHHISTTQPSRNHLIGSKLLLIKFMNGKRERENGVSRRPGKRYARSLQPEETRNKIKCFFKRFFERERAREGERVTRLPSLVCIFAVRSRFSLCVDVEFNTGKLLPRHERELSVVLSLRSNSARRFYTMFCLHFFS